MIESVGRYEFVIDAYLSDFQGRATLPMLGGFMLQVATKHAEERGFGYTYMTNQNRAWVLSRIGIEIYEYPKNDTKVIIYSWVSDVNRLFTERRFSFEDEHGKVYGYAKSLWASLDMETRRATNILDLDSMISIIEKDKHCPIDSLLKINQASLPFQKIDDFVVKYSDIDINGHLNSIKYIEHFIDVFDLDIFKEKNISRIDLNYISEGKFGSSVAIYENKVEDDGLLTSVLDMRCADSSICLAKVIWK